MDTPTRCWPGERWDRAAAEERVARGAGAALISLLGGEPRGFAAVGNRRWNHLCPGGSHVEILTGSGSISVTCVVTWSCHLADRTRGLSRGRRIHGKGLCNDLTVVHNNSIGAHRDVTAYAPGDIGNVPVDSQAPE